MHRCCIVRHGPNIPFTETFRSLHRPRRMRRRRTSRTVRPQLSDRSYVQRFDCEIVTLTVYDTCEIVSGERSTSQVRGDLARIQRLPSRGVGLELAISPPRGQTRHEWWEGREALQFILLPGSIF